RGEADALHGFVDGIVVPIMMETGRALRQVVSARRLGNRRADAKIRHARPDNIRIDDIVAVLVVIERSHMERLMDVTDHVDENPQRLALGQIYGIIGGAVARVIAAWHTQSL